MTRPTRIIGHARRRVDGRAKVTGQTRFADDIVLPRMLHYTFIGDPESGRAITAATGSPTNRTFS